MNREEYNTMMNSDEWMLLSLLEHKKNPNAFPIDLVKFRESLEESIADCETGMALGVGWHGGMTPEEWATEKKYLERVRDILNTL